VAAGGNLHEQARFLRHGYSRITDVNVADAGWTPAFTIKFALDILEWKNPARPERMQRCIDIIARYINS